VTQAEWLRVAAICYKFSKLWHREGTKPIAVYQRWWWLLHNDHQRWSMCLSLWQGASIEIRRSLRAECDVQQIDTSFFMISANPDLNDELGLEMNGSDWSYEGLSS